jgi:hypothetical protein
MFYIMAHSDSTRSGMAFAQHVNLRASEKGLLGGANPWTSSYAQKAFNIDVNHNLVNINATIGDFYRANPRLFLEHIVHNLRDYKTVVLLLLVLSISVRPWVGGRHVSLRPASVFVFMVSLPVIAASILIYPRHHYAVIITPSLLLLALQMVSTTQQIKWIKSPSVSWFLIPLAFAVMFIANIGRRALQKGPASSESSNVLVIHCLRNLERSDGGDNPVMFDPLGMPNVYLRSPRIHVADYDIPDAIGFESWVARTRPGWVVIIPSVAKEYRVPSASIDQFFKSDLGYTSHFCPQLAGMTIYVSHKRLGVAESTKQK